MWSLLRNGRVLLGVLVVVALLAVAMWPQSIEVEFASVTRGALMVTIDEDGRTRVRDRFVVASPVGGEVLRISLEPGDRVEKGRTTLAVVRPAAPLPLDARSRAEAEAAAGSAEAAVGRATAEHGRAVTAARLAGQQYQRSEVLAQGGALAREVLEAHDAELQAAQDAVKAAEFAVAQARQELEVARARLAPGRGPAAARDWVIVAPVDGVVLTRHGESQRVVPAGQPLMEIGDPGRMEIVADLLSADAVKVRPGSAVLIEEWGGPLPLEGTVRRIEPAGFTKISALGVEEQRVNVIIDFDAASEAAAPLGDNFRVEVRIVVWQQDSVLKAPVASIFRIGDGWAVYVIEDGVANVRPITLGERNAREVQVLDGLSEADAVIVYPPDTLQDGSRVSSE